MSIKHTIIRNTLLSGATSFALPLIGFFLVPFMILRLGVVEYGLIGITQIFAIGGYVGALEMGLQVSITKYVAQYDQANDHPKLCRLINSTLVVFVLMGLVAAMVGLSLSEVLVKVFPIPDEYQQSLRMLLWLIFASYLFQFPHFVFLGLFEGLQRFDILKGVQVAFALIYAAGVVVLLSLGASYVSVVVLSLSTLLGQFISFVYFAFRELSFLRVGARYLSGDVLREIAHMTKHNFARKISSLLYNQTDRLLVGAFLGPVFMTSYQVLYKLPQLLKQLVGFGNAAILPAASQLKTLGNERMLNNLFARSLAFNLYLSIPLVTSAMYLARPFLHAWVGDEFDHLALLLQVLLVWNLFVPLVTIGPSLLVGINARLAESTALSWTNTLLKVAVTLVLIRQYQLLGAVIGTLASLLTTPLFVALCLREFRMRFRTLVREFLPIFLLAVVPLGAVLGLEELVDRDDWTMLLLNGTVWCLSYWIALYFIALTKQDKLVLIELLSRLCPRLTRERPT